jgi:hypothetical protein
MHRRLCPREAHVEGRTLVTLTRVLSRDSLTVVLCSALCILLAIAIVNRKPWRHFVQVFLCVMELYGGTRATPRRCQRHLGDHS